MKGDTRDLTYTSGEAVSIDRTLVIRDAKEQPHCDAMVCPLKLYIKQNDGYLEKTRMNIGWPEAPQIIILPNRETIENT